MNWYKTAQEKIKIYRALPASTTVIRTKDYITLSLRFANEHAVTSAIYNGEPFYVVTAIVNKSDLEEATNPGEYFYMGKPIEAKPIQIANEDGDWENV